MKYVIIKNGIPIETVEATDINEAMDAAVLITGGVFDDVAQVGSAEYNTAVQARGKKASEQMNKDITTVREGIVANEGGVNQYIAPYTRQAELSGKDAGMIEGAKDFFSLPGRAIMGAGPFSTTTDWESMKVPSEKREGTVEKIVTSPATGVSIALTPLAMLAGGGIGGTTLLANSPRLAPWLVGATEGATIGAGTSTFRGMTEEEYGIADAASETILSTILGGTLSGASASAINKAKSFINQSGKFTPAQIDYIYSKLGITRSGTEQKLSQAVPERIGDIANIEYGTVNPFTGKPRVYVTEDIAGNIPKDVAKSYQESIKQSRINGMNITDKRAKEAILKEFNESMNELTSTDYNEAGRYLDRLLEEAKYFYQKDPELGQIMLNKIEDVYKLNYDLMANAPQSANINLSPMSNLSSKFGDISATSEYLANPPRKIAPRPFNVVEPGSLVGQTAGRVINSPEKAKIVGNTLQSLRMPSIVSTQDALSNTPIPDYINLNELK